MEIIERLIRLETMLENHLAYHSKMTKYLLFPILIGIILLLFKTFFIHNITFIK